MPVKSEHRARQPFLRLVGRALRNRCPVCGTDRVFEGLWRMRHHCHACTYVYDREQGYFLGAMYVNYGVTCALALGLFFAVEAAGHRSAWSHLAYLLPIVAVFPLIFYRYSRMLWMAVDVFFSTPGDEDFLPPPGGL